MYASKKFLQEHKVGFIFSIGEIHSAELDALTPRAVALLQTYFKTSKSIRTELQTHPLFVASGAAAYRFCNTDSGFIEGETASYAIWLSRTEEIPQQDYSQLFDLVMRHLRTASCDGKFKINLLSTPQKRVYRYEEVSAYPWWLHHSPLQDTALYSRTKQAAQDTLSALERMESICTAVSGTVGSWDTEELNGIAAEADEALKALPQQSERAAEVRKPLEQLLADNVSDGPEKEKALDAINESMALVVAPRIEKLEKVCRYIASNFDDYEDKWFKSLAKEARETVEFLDRIFVTEAFS